MSGSDASENHPLQGNFARFHCYKLLHCVPGGVSLCTKDIAYRGDRYVDLIRFPDKCSFYSANCRQLGHFWVLEEDKCHGWMPYNEQWYLDRYTKEPTEPTEAKEHTPRSDEDTEPVTTVSATTVTTASSKDTEPVTTVSPTTVTTASSKDTEPVTTVSPTTVTTASSKDTEPVTTVSATTVTTASSKDTEPVTTVSQPESLRTPSDKDAIERARFLRHILKNMNFGLLNSN
nr:uncharacterized protein LOC110376271 [Helicoverpa armigera]